MILRKCLVLLLSFSGSLLSQDLGIIENTNVRHYQINYQGDTINFIKLTADTATNKPVILILQGSLPIPLAIKYREAVSFTSFPYQLTSEHLNRYHVIAISMPHIPTLVDQNEIAPNGTLVNPPSAYNKDNYLDNYVNRANAVIDYISQCKWADPNSFTLFGHSQGCYVAIKLALQNSKIKKLGLASLSPHGRYHQYLRIIRYQEHTGIIDATQAQNQIEEHYDRWRHIVINRNDDSQERGNTFKATYSFSENFVDDLLVLDIPIYIAYGTRDIGSLGCDILPLEFEKTGKQNYKLQSYPGLGHNFEEIDSSGQSNYDKMYWDEVFQEFINWSQKNNGK